ncbi:hypothetical protein HN803_07870 [candidate division WWE3 bacterium]|jgi:hypothetical protein|nr:hypothetical protein [candidate division WWE3 bacterium]MBT7350669.1 hypothetical protein [candidate division WWE3 bacterium]
MNNPTSTDKEIRNNLIMCGVILAIAILLAAFPPTFSWKMFLPHDTINLLSLAGM